MLDNILDKLPPEVTGLCLAMFMAFVRILGDERDNKFIRILLESGICGGLSWACSYAVIALGASANWSVFLGGAIGYLGSATIHALAVKFIHSKIDKK